jgi:hypothetical protein
VLGFETHLDLGNQGEEKHVVEIMIRSRRGGNGRQDSQNVGPGGGQGGGRWNLEALLPALTQKWLCVVLQTLEGWNITELQSETG